MSEQRFNLLSEPLLELVLPDGSRTGASLPGVLARLSAGEAIEFGALQAHQSHSWHAFLVQLAAIAVNRQGDGSSLPIAEEEWLQLLRALTSGDDAPWCLVVEELTRAAFMQPPVPEGTLAGFQRDAYVQPDALDVLVTTRNHDVKSARMAQPRSESWVYMLVSVQTAQGYSGPHTYGVARMNGGYSNRPALGIACQVDWPSRFERDVGVWLAERQHILASAYGYRPEGGLALLWLVPWDGESSLALADCDPFFIEVCRRLRLQSFEGRLVARFSPTNTARLDAKELKGDTGDIWTPVRRKDGAGLTVGSSGFSYSLMQELLLGADFRPNPALEIREDDSGELFVLAQALVRGMGTTDGWHERIVPIPPRVRMLFRSNDARERLARLSSQRVMQVDTMRRSVLRYALLTLLQGAPEKLNKKDDRARPWLAKLDDAVDREFFERLWADAELTGNEAEAHWDRWLLDLARSILEEAIREVPMPSVRQYRIIAVTERAFDGAARRHFPAAFEQLSPSPPSNRKDSHGPAEPI
jgi:CRISPR system Cascade subunit CasA